LPEFGEIMALGKWLGGSDDVAGQASNGFDSAQTSAGLGSPALGMPTGLKVFLDPYAQTSLADLRPLDMKVTLLTGPEGGFAEHERELARAAGFIPVRLGGRVLRTETASLTALAAVQMLWGDFR